MVDYLEQLGLSKSMVHARIEFLIDRANVHSKEAQIVEGKQSWRRIAGLGAAGTCHAEAASLSMLLGRNADDLLYQAAQNYLLAEHPYGMFLMSLTTRPDEAKGLIANSPMNDGIGWLDRVVGQDALPEDSDDELIPRSCCQSISNSIFASQ